MKQSTKKLIERRFGKLKIFRDGFDVKKVVHSGKSGLVKPVVQEKPWGAEVWWIYGKKYAAKILFVEPGKRFSLHKHKKRIETWLIMSGNPEITLGQKKIQGKPGMVMHVASGTVHRPKAGSSMVELFEVSSPELDDIIRLSDDYGR